MSQDQAVAAPSRTSTFRNELNDAVGIFFLRNRLSGELPLSLPDYAIPYFSIHHHTLFFYYMVTWNCTGIGNASFKKCSRSLIPNWKRLQSQRFLR